MSAIALDASAAIRVVLAPQENQALLDLLDDAPPVYAPQLLIAETANALWKYVRAGRLDASIASEAHADALSLVDELIDDAALFPEALQMASQCGQPVYDCMYLVVARRHAASLLSADERLRGLGKKIGVSALTFS